MGTAVIHKELGAYIGILAGYAVFSKNDPIGSTNVFTFRDEAHAKEYFASKIGLLAEEDLKLITIPVHSGTYISCIDLIKAGHGEEIKEMINHLPMQSEVIH